jgi:hypothetical protein
MKEDKVTQKILLGNEQILMFDWIRAWINKNRIRNSGGLQ